MTGTVMMMVLMLMTSTVIFEKETPTTKYANDNHSDDDSTDDDGDGDAPLGIAPRLAQDLHLLDASISSQLSFLYFQKHLDDNKDDLKHNFDDHDL